MPQLEWNETDFMECLEVIPKIEDYEVEHVYEVKRKGLVLIVIVWQFESVVWLSVRQQEADAPLIEFALFVREVARYVKDKRGEYLEFRNCIVAPSRFSYLEMGDVFDTTKFKQGLTVQLTIEPHIQIRHIGS